MPTAKVFVRGDLGLWIQGNCLHSLSIRSLKLYEYDGERIGDSIAQLPQLTHLTIDECYKLKYVSNVMMLHNLQVLMFFHCDSLEELPENLGDLRNLTHLHLSYCFDIKCLPNSIAQLSKLSTLEVEHCSSLEELPANLGELSNLTHFNLSDCCRIKSLPGGLTNLQRLDLQLCYLSKQRFRNFKEAGRVTQLNISICRSHPVDQFPKYLNDFDSLKRLSIKNISFSMLNLTSFAALCNLQRLQIGTYINEIPINFDELPQLLFLDIQGCCNIKYLPCNIQNLLKLQFIGLPWCFKLETLPVHLSNNIIISVNGTHIRKTWEELKLDMGPLYVQDMFIEAAQHSSPLLALGYLYLEDDLFTWISNQYLLRSSVRILDLVLPDTAGDFGDVIGALPNLTHLYIKGRRNYKCHLDTSTKIAHLSLNGCDLDYYSGSLRKLPSLKYLELDCLFYTPEALNLPCCLEHLTFKNVRFHLVLDTVKQLPHLNTLELHFCNHFSLPENLNLTKLKLVHSCIKSLPTSLCHLEIIQYNCEKWADNLKMCLTQLVSLKTLSFTCHYVKFLSSLVVPRNLQKLVLKDCFRLRGVVSNMDELVELHTLDISGTRIKSLPECITKLPKLQHLVLPKCFKKKNLPSNFESIVNIRFDCTDEMYYENMGYYDFDSETSDEDNEASDKDNEITPGFVVGDDYIVQRESSEGNINVQSSSWGLINPPEGLGDFNISGRNCLIGENRHQSSRHLQNHEMEGLYPGVHSMEVVDDSNGEYQQMGTVNLRNGANNLLAVIYSQSNNNLHGAHQKGNRQKIEITREQIQSLREENLSLVEAGKKLRVSRSTMKRRCKELGLGEWPSSKKKKSNSCKKIIKTKSHTRGELSLPSMVQCSNPANPEYARESFDANQQNFFDQEARKWDPIDKSIPKAKTDREVNVGSQSHMIVQESIPECTVGADAHSLLGTRIARMCTGNFPWPSDVPEFFLPYIKGWTDVRSDGNCGFRVIAEACYDEQEFWPHVRQAMCLEMEANRDQYSTLYGGSHGPREAISRISGHMYGQALPCYWIQTPLDLCSASTVFCVAFVLLATRPTTGACATILPLRSWSGAKGPNQIIGIAHVNGDHYVLVYLCDNCPLPPVWYKWEKARHESVAGWKDAYTSRIIEWTNLRGNVDQDQVAPHCDLIDVSTPDPKTESGEALNVANQSHMDVHESSLDHMVGRDHKLLGNVQDSSSSSSLDLKVTYKEDIVRFKLSTTAGLKELKEAVVENLRIEFVSFKLKYQDEEEDWVLINTDEHLRRAVSLIKNNVLRLKVTDL